MKRASVAIALSLVACSSAAMAGVSDQITLGGSIARAWALGEFRAPDPSNEIVVYRSGVTGSGFGDIWFHPQLALGLDVRYTVFDGRSDPVLVTSDQRTDFLLTAAHVRWRPFGLGVSSKPWLQAGIGIVSAHDLVAFQEPMPGPDPGLVVEWNETGTGFFLGGGLTVWNNGHGVDVGLSGSYCSVSQDLWPYASGFAQPEYSFKSDVARGYFTVGVDVTLTRESATGRTE